MSRGEDVAGLRQVALWHGEFSIFSNKIIEFILRIFIEESLTSW